MVVYVCGRACVEGGCATRLQNWPIWSIESRDWTRSYSLSESCHSFKGKRNSLAKGVVLTAALLTAQWRPDQQEGAGQALLHLIRSVVYGHLFCFLFVCLFPFHHRMNVNPAFFLSMWSGNVEQKKERRDKKACSLHQQVWYGAASENKELKLFFVFSSVKLAIPVIPYISWLLLTSTTRGFPHNGLFACHVKAVV